MTIPFITVALTPANINDYFDKLDAAGQTYQFIGGKANNHIAPFELELWLDDTAPGVNIQLKRDGTWTATAALTLDVRE